MSRMLPVDSVRKAEAAAVVAGTAEFDLMLSAGRQAADIIHHHYPDAIRFVVLCGGGNNGGDALVAARVLNERYHREVVVYSVKGLGDFTGCAAFAAKQISHDIRVLSSAMLRKADILPGDVIIDGLLGIGFSGGALRVEVRKLIEIVNSVHNPVVALDLPSGMNGDSGEISSDGAVEADLTITFGAVKPGLFSGNGSALRGCLRLVDIGLPEVDGAGEDVFTNIDAVEALTLPEADCHKNSRGRVLIWGGSEEYPGAPVLSAKGALYASAGIVRLISCGECRDLAPAAVIVKKIPNGSDVKSEVVPFFPVSDVLVAGCGWGKETPREALSAVWEFPGKIILDADALNMFSVYPEAWGKHDNVLITPHPGEAARLADALGITARDRKQLAGELAGRLGCVVLLKGRDSVLASPDGRSLIIASGNHLLATAGSGDVLTGIIAAQAAKMPLFEAAALGAYIHGVAGETADRPIIADELPELSAQVIGLLYKNSVL